MNLTTARFSGHESFALRNTWLTKGVLECEENPSIFREPDALVRLGVGKNMVGSIRYWCLATRVIEKHSERRYDYQPTRIGRSLFLEDGGWDRFLEDEGTVWLLHWLLATNPEFATTIYYVFNELNGLEFTRTGLEDQMAKQAAAAKGRASSNTIKRDVGVCIRSYAGGHDRPTASVEDTMDCPLAELGLLYEEPTRHVFAFMRGPKDSLPSEVILYALYEYAQRQSGQRSFTFDELAYRQYSPGRVFKLDESSLAEHLEHAMQLTDGAWQLTETAGYRQMLITREIDPYQILERYYCDGSRRNVDGLN